ncbi:MAG: glycosyltransferase family 4 protein [Planctomycetes bacterium]|nr:glycosyltransferase family 4 protein [Planctomycetota bacterium]
MTLENIRILQIANEAGPLRLFVLPVCDALKAQGAQVELACMEDGPNFAPLAAAGYPLHAIPRGSWKKPTHWVCVYRHVRRLLKAGRYDLMVVHTPVMSWIARYASRGLVGATMYVAHGLPFTPRQPWHVRTALRMIEQFAGRYTDAVLVMNEIDEHACRRYRLTRPGGFCMKIPGVGVNVDAYAQPLDDATRRQIDAEFALRPDKPLLLYLGRFIPDKRPGDILELARRLGDRADFLLAGEGPLWDQIAAEARKIGPHVHVIGWTDKSADLVRRCTLALFPSIFREGLPRFLLEAAAAGKPAIAYDVRGNCDVIQHGATGALVQPEDVDAFCSEALNLLDDPYTCQHLGAHAAGLIRQDFGIARSVQFQVDCIRTSLQNRRAN